jgi:PleD family two-component response regulator
LARLRPHHVIEEQLTDVLRREAGKLESGTVHDGLTELANLRVDMKSHDDPPVRV